MRGAMVMGLFLLAGVASAAPRKVVLKGVAGGEGVPEATAQALAEAVAAELRRLPSLQVVTPREVAAVLSNEQQKQLLGCEQDACLTELGGALGVDELVTGDMGRLGESWLVHLRRIDARKAVTLRQVDRRLRKGSIDDVLDQLPSMAAELFEASTSPPPPASLSTNAAAPPSAPRGGREVNADLPADLRARLVWWSDGAGLVVAHDPRQASFDPFYAGDGRRMWAQRVTGGGASGDDFDRVFWEPRVRARWQGAFEVKEGKAALQCGDAKVALSAVDPRRAAAFTASAEFFAPRWSRRAYALARDDTGTYYFVDQAREPERNEDFRLFVGRKGRLAYRPVEEAVVDDAGLLFITSAGRLAIDARAGKAEWISGTSRTPLVRQAVEEQVTFIYGALGVYADEALGTPCDGRLGKGP